MKEHSKLFIILLVLIILSCINDEKEGELIFKRRPYPKYRIDSKSDTSIIAKNGTILKIPGGAFIDENNEEPRDSIILIFDDFYDKDDFIKNNLTTETKDGALLESSGMIYLAAYKDGRELYLKNDKSISISFRRLFSTPKVNLFLGQKNSEGVIKWDLTDKVYKDTTVFVEENIYSIYGENMSIDSIAVNVSFIIGYDTIYMDSTNKEVIDEIRKNHPERVRYSNSRNSDSSSMNGIFESNEFITKYYDFTLNQLGWINCDIFINEELNEYVVKINENNASLWVVFESLNSVAFFSETYEGQYNLDLPINQNIKLIAYKSMGDSHSLGIVNSNTSDNNVSIELQEIDMDSIQQIINQL